MFKSVIIQSSNQIHSQHKSSAAVAVFARHNAKDFQMSNNVFNYHARSCQLFVELFLFGVDLPPFGFLIGVRASSCKSACFLTITMNSPAVSSHRKNLLLNHFMPEKHAPINYRPLPN
jgi:hypothetical protein